MVVQIPPSEKEMREVIQRSAAGKAHVLNLCPPVIGMKVFCGPSGGDVHDRVDAISPRHREWPRRASIRAGRADKD